MDLASIKKFFASLTLQKLVPVILIVVIGLLLVKLLLKLFDRVLERSRLERTMFSFLRAAMRTLLYTILVLVAASSLGVDVTSLVAILSVVSLAISLAVQNALSNVVGSVTLLTTHPFHVGDFVEIGSDSGTVEEISVSYTKLATVDGKRIYIPNSDAASARICNYSVEGRRRVDLLYTILVLVAASSLGVDVTSLVAILSVVSLAISLAVQNALSNVVGSVTLLTTHPFHVGDFVEIGSDSGTVEEISVSYTKLATVDGKRIYIPNSDAASARICNYSVEGRRRVDLYIGVSYDAPAEKVREALLAAAQHPKALQDPAPLVVLNNYQDSSIQYLLMLWTASGDYLDVRFAVNEAVKRELDARGIAIPYPQLDVHFEPQKRNT